MDMTNSVLKIMGIAFLLIVATPVFADIVIVCDNTGKCEPVIVFTQNE